MKRTAKRPNAEDFTRITDAIWSKTVDDSIRGLPCVDEDGNLRLFEQDSDVPVIMKPGERRIHVKQRQFMRATGKYSLVLYGGSMRSGKSYIGLWNCIYWLLKWYKEKGLVNVRVGIFCETYQALYDRQISMLDRYLPSGLGKYVGGDKRLFKLKRKFGGGEIYFRNLDKPEKYKSVNFALIFVDEINENGTPDVYETLSTRLQWPGISHCAFTAACNPGGPGHGWVYDLCINKESDSYLKPTKRPDGTEIPGVFFIQALPGENPYLDVDYYLGLRAKLSEKKYKMWVLGDWTSFAGQFFDQFETAVHVRPRKGIPKGWKRFRAMDLGRAHPFVCLWGAVSPGGTLYVYRELSVVGKEFSWVKRRIAQLSEGEEYEITVGGHDMNRKQWSMDGDKTVREGFNSEVNGGNFHLIIGDHDRRGRCDALYDALSFERGPSFVNSDGFLEMGKIKRKPKIYIQHHCKYLINSVRLMQHDKTNEEMYAKTKAKRPGQGDDETDALALLWQWCSKTVPGMLDFENEDLPDISDHRAYDDELARRDEMRAAKKRETKFDGYEDELAYVGESSFSDF